MFALDGPESLECLKAAGRRGSTLVDEASRHRGNRQAARVTWQARAV